MNGVFERAAQQGFGIAANGRERSAEFVGDVGDKIAAHAFEAFDPGDVMQNHQRATVRGHGERRCVGLKDGGVAPHELEPARGRSSLGDDFGNEAQEGRIPNHADERRVTFDRRLQPQGGFESLVGELNAHLVVDREYAFSHALEDGVQTVGFVAEPFHEFVYAARHAPQGLVQGVSGVVFRGQRGLCGSGVQQVIGESPQTLDSPGQSAGKDGGHYRGADAGEDDLKDHQKGAVRGMRQIDDECDAAEEEKGREEKANADGGSHR